MYGLGLGRGFTHTVLERVPPHVLVHAEHPAASRPERSIALKDLDGEPAVVLDLPHSRDYYEQLYAIAGVVPNVRHRFAGYETVRSFVAKGHGYAVLNQRLHSDLTYSGGRVVALTLTDDFPPIEVMLRPARGGATHPVGHWPLRRPASVSTVPPGTSPADSPATAYLLLRKSAVIGIDKIYRFGQNNQLDRCEPDHTQLVQCGGAGGSPMANPAQ